MANHITCDICNREIEHSEIQHRISGSAVGVLWKFIIESSETTGDDVCENCMARISKSIYKEMNTLDTRPRLNQPPGSNHEL